MASSYFTIDKTTGSSNTTVTVTSTLTNDTVANRTATLTATDGTLTATTTIEQMYRPKVAWNGVNTVSADGGTINISVKSPYVWWFRTVPACVTNITAGTQYAAGSHSIDLKVSSTTSTTAQTYSIQIAFQRIDEVFSYETEDGKYGFTASFTQKAKEAEDKYITTPQTVQMDYDLGESTAVVVSSNVSSYNITITDD